MTTETKTAFELLAEKNPTLFAILNGSEDDQQRRNPVIRTQLDEIASLALANPTVITAEAVQKLIADNQISNLYSIQSVYALAAHVRTLSEVQGAPAEAEETSEEAPVSAPATPADAPDPVGAEEEPAVSEEAADDAQPAAAEPVAAQDEAKETDDGGGRKKRAPRNREKAEVGAGEMETLIAKLVEKVKQLEAENAELRKQSTTISPALLQQAKELVG